MYVYEAELQHVHFLNLNVLSELFFVVVLSSPFYIIHGVGEQSLEINTCVDIYLYIYILLMYHLEAQFSNLIFMAFIYLVWTMRMN